jgi:hypothetical protein
MKRKTKLTIAIALAGLAVLGRHDRLRAGQYSVKSPSGYALFNYEAASDKFTVDPTGVSDCGHACHTAVRSKDYIFHPYQKR